MAAAAFVGWNASAAAEGDEATETGGIANGSVPIDASLAFPIALPDAARWRYVPDPAPFSTLGATTQVNLPGSGNVGDQVERILLSRAMKQALVVYKKTSRAGSGENATTYICNLENGQVEATWEGGGQSPLCVTPDGTGVLCGNSAIGGNVTELSFYKRSDNRLEPLLVWKPYGPGSGVAWAKFADDNHVLTFSDAGVIALWKVPDLQPLWTTTIEPRAVLELSGGGNTLAIVTASGIKLVNVRDGSLVGVIVVKLFVPRSAALSEDGKRLAVCSGSVGDQIRVWNLDDGSMEREFTLATALAKLHLLEWADNRHLIAGGALLVDVDRRVEIWHFTDLGQAAVAADGNRLWFIKLRGGQPATLASLAIPTKNALEAAAHWQPDQLLVMQPGMEVQLDLSGPIDLQGARDAFTAKLTENEMRVSSQATVRIQGEIRELPRQRIRVRKMGALGPHNIAEHEFTPRMGIVSIFAGNDLVWQRTMQRVPGGNLDLQPGESVDDALARLTKADLSLLTIFELPRYLARIP